MTLTLKFLIDGINRTANVPEKEWDLDLHSGPTLDTINLTLDDPTNSITVLEGKDLIIEDDGDSSFRLFAGIISDVLEEPEGIGRRYNITAQDWKIILDRTTFTKDYRNQTDIQNFQP